ncbi:MAG: prolyl oligopeptidase family serine peptidase [Deltaproteobacteria bacterium]
MKRPVLVTLLVLAPAVAFGLSEIELRQTKIQALQQQIMQTQARAMRDDVVLDASERFGKLVNTAILEAHPELDKKLARSTELKDRMRRAMKKQDVQTMKLIAKELRPLTEELAEFEAKAMEKHSGLAAAYDALQGLVYETMLKVDPDTEANMIAVDRLQVEIDGLQGKLRKTPPGKAPKITKARKGFRTKVFGPTDGKSAATPPRGVLEMVRYPAPLGKNVAYVTPKKAKKGPAIVWIAGGFYWGIGPDAWLPSTRDNDQSAAAFREAGVTLMRPALRGAHDNPGKSECMLGEVDDIIAAAKWLAKRSDVDPHRIYLGGHSTGGTLALLTAAKSDMFRGVFAFGPIANAADYGPICGQKKAMPAKEAYVRAPIEFIEHVKSPTWIIEGANGNRRAVLELLQYAPNNVFPFLVPKTDHFSVLRPASEVIAKKILADKGKKTKIELNAEAVMAAMK